MADTHDGTEAAQDSPSERLAHPSRDRMTLYMRPKTRQILGSLQVDMEAGSASEVIRRSVTVVRMLVEAQRSGARILIERPGETVERVEVVV